MSDKAWRILQILGYVIIFGGGSLAVYITSEPVGGGNWRMVERPWWLNWFGGLVVISAFVITLVEVRSRNGGVLNRKVFGQTIFWMAIIVGSLMFIWYLRGDFN